MQKTDFRTWTEFEEQVRQLKELYRKEKAEGMSVSAHLFRGHRDADWPLLTTLERRSPDKTWSFSEYFRYVAMAQPQVETFTGKSWNVPDWAEIRDWSRDYQSLHRDQSRISSRWS